ncbi:MAG: alpha/beta hydrolase-fold protein [Planctomycetota bacterium]|nr:alpha/beta hydrolase-fold protein [Planctomycetota bacterium]
MNRMHRTLAASLGVVLGGACAAWAQPAKPGEEAALVFVEDLSGMFETTPLGTLYMGSSANGWDAKGTWSMGHFAPTSRTPGGWMFTLPRTMVESGSGLEFKFTRGTWATVEVDASGRDVPNRRLPPIDWSKAGGPDPLVTLRVEGFADQRGTRWPGASGGTGGGPSPSTVVGELEIDTWTSALLGNERRIRVWLPPGYAAAAQAGQRFPVLYMHDGQNLFDAATSFAGEWRVDETMTALIRQGKVPPTIVVGIDNTGATRSDEYSPIELGARRPGTGGKGDLYLRAIVEELKPWIDNTYSTLTGPEHTSIGGSSLGGVITLTAAMSGHANKVFGRFLAESPSFWVGDGAFLERVTSHKGWSGRVFMAMGSVEYGEASSDAQLVAAMQKAADAMRRSGLSEQTLRVRVGEGARHNEAAWADRLPEALEFLLGEERAR